MTDRHRQILPLEDVVAYLNAAQIRATYGAVADLVGGIAQSIGTRLGGSWGRRPEASWVVNARTGLPTDYRPHQRHPNLLRTPEVISTGVDLRRRVLDWQAAGRPNSPVTVVPPSQRHERS